MDWKLAISRNQDALLRMVAVLFALVGLSDGKPVKSLPRHVHSAVLRVLRPAEFALRRLILIAAHGLVVAARHSHSVPINIARNSSSTHRPAFCLIDPLKCFSPFVENAVFDEERGQIYHEPSFPRISVPGQFDPVFTSRPVFDAQDLIDATHLCHRLLVFKLALENLPKQARRLARWHARRDIRRAQFPFRTGRSSPLRPGAPWATTKRKSHEIDRLLRECHGLARDLLNAPSVQNTT